MKNSCSGVRKNSKLHGFTMVEVIMAVGVLTVLIIGVTQLLTSVTKSQKSVQNNVDFDVIKNSLSQILKSRACDNSFRDAAGNKLNFSHTGSLSPGDSVLSTPVNIIKVMQGNREVIDMSKPLLAGGLELTKLQLSDG
ncbi:MAG: hypothetical protein KA116_03940, partial [Proteobacteria bacterium]|nr:hypothetical protein [Pseudomonadota bacterium]